MEYRNLRGYVLEDKSFHVCGYEGNTIMVQYNKEGIEKPKSYKLYDNTVGTYFNFKGKRVYVDRKASKEAIQDSEESNELSYEVAKKNKQELNALCDKLSEKLNRYEKGIMGLTPAHVRELDEWKKDKRDFDTAFAMLRNFNKWFVKTFKKEIQAERNSRYASKEEWVNFYNKLNGEFLGGYTKQGTFEGELESTLALKAHDKNIEVSDIEVRYEWK